MYLAFSSPELRDLCQGMDQAQERWGAAIATQLRHRLADLEAVHTPLDLAPGLHRFAGQGLEEHMIFRLASGYCLFVFPNITPKKSETGIVWRRVARVRITGVEVCDEWNT